MVPAFYKPPVCSGPRFPVITTILDQNAGVLHSILLSLASALVIYVPVGLTNYYFIYENIMSTGYFWNALMAYVISAILIYPLLLFLQYKVITTI